MNRRKGLTTLFMFIHYYVEETEIRGGKTGRRLSTKSQFSIFIKFLNCPDGVILSQFLDGSRFLFFRLSEKSLLYVYLYLNIKLESNSYQTILIQMHLDVYNYFLLMVCGTVGVGVFNYWAECFLNLREARGSILCVFVVFID